MSMFELNITSRWVLMAARSWARLILDRRRGLINDRPSRAAAAESPLGGAQERHHFDNPTRHSRGAFYHGEAALLTCIALYFFLKTSHRVPRGLAKEQQRSQKKRRCVFFVCC